MVEFLGICVGAVALLLFVTRCGSFNYANSGTTVSSYQQLKPFEVDFIDNVILLLSSDFRAGLDFVLGFQFQDPDRFRMEVNNLGARLLQSMRLPPAITHERATHLVRVGIRIQLDKRTRSAVANRKATERAIAEAERDVSVERAIKALVDKYEDVLVRKIRQLVVRDDYGREVSKRWDQELDFFVDEIIRDEAADAYFDWYLDESSEHRTRCKAIIDAAVRAAEQESRDEGGRPFDEAMSPIEFEHFCAEELRFAGWDARVTQASGDQGVDIVASMKGARMVVQCKLYSHPVGNDAVQQAYAGMVHEGADAACVVSNQSFTRSARELASTTGVLLLHYSELRYARAERGSRDPGSEIPDGSDVGH